MQITQKIPGNNEKNRYLGIENYRKEAVLARSNERLPKPTEVRGPLVLSVSYAQKKDRPCPISYFEMHACPFSYGTKSSYALPTWLALMALKGSHVVGTRVGIPYELMSLAAFRPTEVSLARLVVALAACPFVSTVFLGPCNSLTARILGYLGTSMRLFS